MSTRLRAVPLAFIPFIMFICIAKFAFAADFLPNKCGDGRVDLILENFESTAHINVFKPDSSIAGPKLNIESGCNGQSLAFGYDLTNASSDGQSWVVLQWPITATNVTTYTHIRLALRSSNPNSHENVDVKLKDADNHLYAVTLKSMTDLQVWRPIYIDLRELTGVGTLDLTKITHIEIGVVRCTTDCEVPDIPGTPMSENQHVGTLYVDEFALVDLKPGAANRREVVESNFEAPTRNITVTKLAATAIYSQISSSAPVSGMVPAWFPEGNPNYNTYAQAEALLVFLYEYEHIGAPKYLIAARNLGRKLLSLQVSTGKTNAGAWYTSYDKSLAPPLRADRQATCNGDETVVNDIDSCEWVGNVGWVLIALGKLQRSGWYDDPTALQVGIEQGAKWMISQVGRDNAYPNLISRGIEGNISAYFGLLAAGKMPEAKQLGDGIVHDGWDPVQRRMKIGVGPTDYATAMDVTGSWGMTFLQSMGMRQEALDAQGYAATVLRTSSFSESITKTVQGYGDIAGPFTVATEFTAQAAVAGIKDADFVMNQLYRLQIQNGPYAGAFPGATDHWYGGSIPPWNTTMSGVSPTAWAYFAACNIDLLSNDKGCLPVKVFLTVIPNIAVP